MPLCNSGFLPEYVAKIILFSEKTLTSGFYFPNHRTKTVTTAFPQMDSERNKTRFIPFITSPFS